MIGLKELLKYSIDKNSSDLHISTGVPAYIRVDGDILCVPFCPVLSKEHIENMLQEVFSASQLEIFNKEMEYDASLELEDIGRFRSSIFLQARGPGAVFRSISKKIPTFADIQAPEIFKDFAHKINGLILVTGATGTGKSTTLASMIDYINQTRAAHIITIEDPIEFVYPSQKSLINQRELHRNTLSFQNALNSALRQDPDVILIGELRDLETIRLALTAAETGHLVFATLHTISAAKTIDRIIDVFEGIEKNMIRTMLAESLVGVISQTLIKNSSGGRIAAFEILTANVAIANLIRDNKIGQMQSVMQFGREAGMQTLDQALQKLVENGEITKESALPHATYKPFFL